MGTLRALHRHLGGALALVSGRPIAELDHFLQPLQLPCAGVHGAELRDAGGHRLRQPDPGVPLLLPRWKSWSVRIPACSLSASQSRWRCTTAPFPTSKAWCATSRPSSPAACPASA
ncbi:trehalose-phosphatase [Cupriavidus basilensis OR16]|uniref:Trehalose-phosphatase n=1 Tax=Cupriavidus basilensis OR16 TaxID=1127483 RepID=H1S7I1_9BURK|nr:trehalose-phosphatase [Cupriavidus basilensis OR16]